MTLYEKLIKSCIGIDGRGIVLEGLEDKNLKEVNPDYTCPNYCYSGGQVYVKTCISCRWRTYKDSNSQLFMESGKRHPSIGIYCFLSNWNIY